jgi:hypothetical protein
MLGEGIGSEIVELDIWEGGREPEGLGGSDVWGYVVGDDTIFCGSWASIVVERKARKKREK